MEYMKGRRSLKYKSLRKKGKKNIVITMINDEKIIVSRRGRLDKSNGAPFNRIIKKVRNKQANKKLEAFRQVVGIWENKDTSFFDKK